jgi:hypothetical protein
VARFTANSSVIFSVIEGAVARMNYLRRKGLLNVLGAFNFYVESFFQVKVADDKSNKADNRSEKTGEEVRIFSKERAATEYAGELISRVR